MELECAGNDFQWNSSIRDSSSCSAQIKKEGKRPLPEDTRSWVRGFRRLGCGFVAWFVGLPLEFVGFVVPPRFAGSWVSRLGSPLGSWLISYFVWFLL